jgi:exoribonuclease R
MRSLRDTTHALDHGLAAIRQEFAVPAAFPPEVLGAAATAARRSPTAHVDRTDWTFATLDPETSTDLDQAFAMEAAGDDILLHYAIADVAWFVDDGDLVDAEAWRRGNTIYLPDGKVSLYPPVLAEGAASLLPDGPRPAVVFHVRVQPDGTSTLEGAERANIRSRAKLAYDRVQPTDLPPMFAEFSHRVDAWEAARGATAVEPPEQLVERNTHGYRLTFRPRLASEAQNSAMSLATNIAVGEALLRAHTGLFRVLAEPDPRAEGRLRHTAHALGVDWPPGVALEQFTRGLDGNVPRNAAFLLAVRRAGGAASYATYQPGVTPWHAAVAATYAHATAPLRRLADRYVVQAALAVANGAPVPDHVVEALPKLPKAMSVAASHAGQIDRAVIDLAEAVMLEGREGSTFSAVVIDEDDEFAKVQLGEVAVVTRVKAKGIHPGDELRVRLVAVDTTRRTVTFERVA